MVGSVHSWMRWSWGRACRRLSTAYSANHSRPVIVELAAARPRAVGGGLDEAVFAGLGVDAADGAVAEVRDVEVVLRVREDLVDRVRPAGERGVRLDVGERLEVLELAGLEVDPVDRGRGDVLDPQLAVHMGGLRRHERLLRAVAVELRRHRQHREGLGRLVEFRGARLVHQRRPEIAVMVAREVEGALGGLFLQDRDRKRLAPRRSWDRAGRAADRRNR